MAWNEIPSRRAITLFEAPSAIAASTSSSRRVNRACLEPSALSKSSANGASGSNVHKGVGRDDNQPGDSRLDGCDDFIAACRAIEDGARARTKRASSVLCVRPIEQNYQRYIVTASIYRQ